MHARLATTGRVGEFGATRDRALSAWKGQLCWR
jgi:hypothetical protein